MCHGSGNSRKFLRVPHFSVCKGLKSGASQAQPVIESRRDSAEPWHEMCRLISRKGSTDMHTKILAALALCLAAVAPASAGEIKGTGEYIDDRKDRGESECRYSGLNDEYIQGTQPERVQSFGQIARVLGGLLGGVPGDACNPTKGPG
jgi:hypothetical protein